MIALHAGMISLTHEKSIKEVKGFLSIDVAYFTTISRIVNTLLHTLPRNLELCALIPCFPDPEPTPYERLALEDHCYLRTNSWNDLLTKRKIYTY